MDILNHQGNANQNNPGDSISHQSEWLGSKIQVTGDAGKDVEKEEHSSTVDGISSLYNHSENQSGTFSENWTWYYWRILQYLSGHISRRCSK